MLVMVVMVAVEEITVVAMMVAEATWEGIINSITI